MYGIEQFIAVLNPPQAAILAVGATEEQVVVEDGELAVRPIDDATLTCDHRAVDGADGRRLPAHGQGATSRSPALAL